MTINHGMMALAMSFPLVFGCAQERTEEGEARELVSWDKNIESFSLEIEDLQEQLQIPGLAFAVVEDGRLLASSAYGRQLGGGESFSTSTPLHIQSITKAFVAVLVMQSVSEGQLELTAPVHRFVPEAALPDEVQIQHLLTHTSEGIVGEQYVYSGSRFALLKPILEQQAESTLEQLLRARIVEPASMKWYDSPRMGTAWGLVSTVDQLTRFVQALDRGDLLEPDALQRLATPTELSGGQAGPISLGWFAQSIQGVPVMWSYGQGGDRDESSALVFRVPERMLTLVVLANHNTMSDWFRLLMGDAGKSAVAMSFFRLFVASAPGVPLPRPDWRSHELDQGLLGLERTSDYSYEGELLGQVLIRAERGDAGEARRLFQVALERYDLSARPDPVVHYATQLFPGYGPSLGIPMGEHLLEDYPDNRWILLAQGGLLLAQGDSGEAAARMYQRILDLPNQQPDILHRLFKSWSWLGLAEAYRDSDPTLARQYSRELLACEDCVGRAQAAALLEELK